MGYSYLRSLQITVWNVGVVVEMLNLLEVLLEMDSAINFIFSLLIVHVSDSVGYESAA